MSSPFSRSCCAGSACKPSATMRLAADSRSTFSSNVDGGGEKGYEHQRSMARSPSPSALSMLPSSSYSVAGRSPPSNTASSRMARIAAVGSPSSRHARTSPSLANALGGLGAPAVGVQAARAALASATRTRSAAESSSRALGASCAGASLGVARAAGAQPSAGEAAAVLLGPAKPVPCLTGTLACTTSAGTSPGGGARLGSLPPLAEAGGGFPACLSGETVGATDTLATLGFGKTPDLAAGDAFAAGAFAAGVTAAGRLGHGGLCCGDLGCGGLGCVGLDGGGLGGSSYSLHRSLIHDIGYRGGTGEHLAPGWLGDTLRYALERNRPVVPFFGFPQQQPTLGPRCSVGGCVRLKLSQQRLGPPRPQTAISPPSRAVPARRPARKAGRARCTLAALRLPARPGPDSEPGIRKSRLARDEPHAHPPLAIRLR
eukprot:scaffold6824_cov118-Isochrysis_galbana.AAC.7